MDAQEADPNEEPVLDYIEDDDEYEKVLMTVHGAKGLEFDKVIIPGNWMTERL